MTTEVLVALLTIVGGTVLIIGALISIRIQEKRDD